MPRLQDAVPGDPQRTWQRRANPLLIDPLHLAPESTRALNAEIDHHLNNGEEDGRPNSRNGYGRKSVLTETAKIELEVPRDRLSTFDPQLIAKYQRRFP